MTVSPTVEGEDFTVVLPVALIFNTDSGDRLCFEISIIEDDIYEEDQQFIVNITSVSPSSAAGIGPISSVIKTIRENQGISTT